MKGFPVSRPSDTTLTRPSEKFVGLFPEPRLLVFFDDVTKEAHFTQLPASAVHRLREEFEEAARLLDRRPHLKIVEPIPFP